MTKLYRFPHLHRFDGLQVCDYAAKITEEAHEVYREMYCNCIPRCLGYKEHCNLPMTDNFIIEIMDVMQACETALRNSGRTEEELIVLMERHNAKDAARGYDKPRGERMSEYIISVSDANKKLADELGCILHTSADITESTEQIVRCRDCKHMYSGLSKEHYNHENICAYIHRECEPDGFCAWGERREDE